MAVDPVKKYGKKYGSGAKKIKPSEDRAQFLKRVQRTFPKVILDMCADFVAASLVYDLDEKVLLAIVETNQKCKDTYQKARALQSAKKNENVELEKEIKKTVKKDLNESFDKRLRMKHWPLDDVEREEKQKECIAISLVQNEGNLVEVEECLTIPLYQITEYIEKNPDLRLMKERGIRVSVDRAASKLLVQANAGNVSAIKTLLTNKAPDEWSDRSNINIKHEGFAPPDDNEVIGSVLALVKGESENA